MVNFLHKVKQAVISDTLNDPSLYYLHLLNPLRELPGLVLVALLGPLGLPAGDWAEAGVVAELGQVLGHHIENHPHVALGPHPRHLPALSPDIVTIQLHMSLIGHNTATHVSDWS